MKKLPFLGAAIALLSSSAALSHDHTNAVEINQIIDVSGAKTLAFSVGAGSVSLTTASGDELELKVMVKDHSHRGNIDLSRAEIELDKSGSEIEFSIDIDDTNQDWVIAVPAKKKVAVNLGAGDIDVKTISESATYNLGAGDMDITEQGGPTEINIGAGDLDIEKLLSSAEISVGSGDVDIKLGKVEYRSIELSTGAGDTRLEGFDKANIETSGLIFSTTEYTGKGQEVIEVSIGAGDVEVVR
ncbi:DUF4097 family beta strand repeat-containing protein [Parendozoicomonas haliclonae]|uniref:Uncharacterized protein n=1 Tax=Parendozoicomonas haliclonae TaxID=1960125 RepID=A0A1X7AI78_9GAMM|nr:DUF4097 family beta strand repeat-containing protein [Parendozoicomonas haliclonae]SMA44310.1 hypothetical protein EHSB41UT_01775 [Parendozoicomonas haliclonae]